MLAIWNSRVNRALEECEDLRIAYLIRNIATREFVLFEEAAQRFIPDDYVWRFNRGNNLEARDKVSDTHWFTWQPHGSQFTIIRQIPGSARRFRITANVPIVDPAAILAHVQFRESWVQIQP